MTLDRKIKWLFGLIVLANVIIVLVVALGAFEPAPPKPLPNPNGYDDFVNAGNKLTYSTNDYRTMTQVELAALVATNTEALKLLRIGLSRECRVPDNYSRDYMSRVLPELSSQKRLALLLDAEGRLEKMQNRTNDAAQSYLDAMCLGQQCCQGGVMISKLSGIACESLGRADLQSLTNSVNSPECREIAQTLLNLDAQETSAQEFLNQEREFVRKAYSLGDRIELLIRYKHQRDLNAHFMRAFQKNQLGRRQLMIDFAARAYELEKGKTPVAITDLVPDYLKAIPKDPVTGSNLILHASAP